MMQYQLKQLSSFSMSIRGAFVAIIQVIIHLLFIWHSIALILPVSLFRFVKYVITLGKKQSNHYNPFLCTHKDVFKSRDDIMKMNGYSIQQFEFQTVDSAYVSFWRIVPNTEKQGLSKPKGDKKYPVVIQHGLLDCAISWFLLEQKKNCLPYILAEQGYDVWIGNNRGTRYSTKNSHQPQYWQYNIDHLAYYDIPCIINSITNVTQSQKLIYIGHSQGTTQFFASLSVHPQLHHKIKCFIGFGPVISLQGLNNHTLIKVVDKLKLCQILKIIGFKTLMVIPVWMSKVIGMLIYNTSLYYHMIMHVVTGLCGKNMNFDKINVDRFGVIISHQPGGTSINNLIHWIQMYRSGGMLCRFDHGKKKNLEIYGQEMPPSYPFHELKNLPFNCHLFKGTSDRLICEQNFNFLRNQFDQEKHSVYEIEDFAHLDYIWSQHAPQQIYYKITQLLSQEISSSSLLNHD